MRVLSWRPLGAHRFIMKGLGPMQTLIGKKIRIIDKNGRDVPDPMTLKRGGAFLGFFASLGAEFREKTGAALVKEPLLKGLHRPISRADLATVKNWVSLEEKIVHDYKEQKTVLLRRPVSPLNIPEANPILPAFETFSTQTTAFLLSSSSKFKALTRPPRGFSPHIERFLWALGWLVVGGLMFFYVQGNLVRHDAVRQLTELQNEKKQLEKSYNNLEKTSAIQDVEIKWLNHQLREMDEAPGSVTNEGTAYDRGGEKKYREELVQLTIQYEIQLDALRRAVRTRDAVINALETQSRVLKSIIGQVRMAAISGVASNFFQRPSLNTGTSLSQGHVLQVNGRQGFIVIDLGAEQGAGSGREVTISRGGVVFADGRVDRVYPTSSAVVIHDGGMLPVIQEGDNVSFS